MQFPADSAVVIAAVRAFYLPGLAPNVFCKSPIEDSKCKVSLTQFIFQHTIFSIALD